VIPTQAVVDEIRIAVGQNEAAAQERARKTLARLRSGETFATVAGAFSETPFMEKGTRVRAGQRAPAYDAVVFSLDTGQISDVLRGGDAFYIVRRRSMEPQRQQTLSERRRCVRRCR
jgi:parvulin-like peptidyl-prolyl isomerase